MPMKRKFLVDEKGKRIAVVLSIRAYNRLLERMEDLEDVHAYDKARALGETPIPLDQALAEIRRNRK